MVVHSPTAISAGVPQSSRTEQVLLVHQASGVRTFPADISRTVGGRRYRDGMSKDGLTRLVVSLMVSGGVTVVDAAHPADAHAAVLRAVRLPGGEMLSRAFGTEVRTVPDPSVGLRVLGLTRPYGGRSAEVGLSPATEAGMRYSCCRTPLQRTSQRTSVNSTDRRAARCVRPVTPGQGTPPA